MVNAGGVGFFRVQYPPHLLDRIFVALANFPEALEVGAYTIQLRLILQVDERVALYSDLFALQANGYVGAVSVRPHCRSMHTYRRIQVLERLEALQHELHPLVWSIVLRGVWDISTNIQLAVPSRSLLHVCLELIKFYSRR